MNNTFRHNTDGLTRNSHTLYDSQRYNSASWTFTATKRPHYLSSKHWSTSHTAVMNTLDSLRHWTAIKLNLESSMQCSYPWAILLFNVVYTKKKTCCSERITWLQASTSISSSGIPTLSTELQLPLVRTFIIGFNTRTTITAHEVWPEKHTVCYD